MKQTKIAVSKLRSFENNPYQVRDDAEMNTLIESIQMPSSLLLPSGIRALKTLCVKPLWQQMPPCKKQSKAAIRSMA